MKIGVLFNIAAGGSPGFGAIGEMLGQRLAGNELLSCEGGFGKAFLPSARALPVEALGYVPRIRKAVELLASKGIDILACVGGDGFASYCAEALLNAGLDLPMLGIAGGTENTGPLIGFDLERIRDLDLGDCITRPVSALECTCGGVVLGYAFNDMVVGDTFLGSIEGRKVNISLETFLDSGEKREQAPSRTITGPDFSVKKNGSRAMSKLGQRKLILAAPLNNADFYRGKAALGAPCIASGNGERAVLAISDRNWIDLGVAAPAAEFSAIEHILFGPGDVVEIGGLAPGGQLVIDGNPFRRGGEAIVLRLHPRPVSVVLPATRRGTMLIPREGSYGSPTAS